MNYITARNKYTLIKYVNYIWFRLVFFDVRMQFRNDNFKMYIMCLILYYCAEPITHRYTVMILLFLTAHIRVLK